MLKTVKDSTPRSIRFPQEMSPGWPVTPLFFHVIRSIFYSHRSPLCLFPTLVIVTNLNFPCFVGKLILFCSFYVLFFLSLHKCVGLFTTKHSATISWTISFVFQLLLTTLDFKSINKKHQVVSYSTYLFFMRIQEQNTDKVGTKHRQSRHKSMPVAHLFQNLHSKYTQKPSASLLKFLFVDIIYFLGKE